MKGRIPLGCLVVALVGACVVRAEHTRFWRQSDYSEFDRGTPRGVAVRSDGKLLPAPRFEEFADPNLAYLWVLATDSHGRLYGAGGSDARVMRLEKGSRPVTVFESPELAAQALAFDAQDNLYIGTTPDGKVYKVTPDGKSSVFFEPKTKYIWALAFDSKGVLFVATGDKGEVFSVAPDGKGQIFYESEERHARSLALDATGNLLIGTEPTGLIFRVEIRRKPAALPEAGAAFVLYETEKKEVTSLATDAKGNIYVAAVGEKVRAIPFIAPAAPAPTPVPAAGAPAGAAAAQIGVAPQNPQPQFAPQFPVFPGAGGAEVVRIAPDGSPETLWSSRELIVYALGKDTNGRLLLGTGDHGAVIQLEGNRLFSSIAKAPSAQVTAFAAGTGGILYVATANPGQVFTLGPGFEKGGSFESETFDAKIFSRWGKLSWWGENGSPKGKIVFYVRSGNTSRPENNWSAWSGPYTKASGEQVACPPARFLQWKAVFQETDAGDAPDISWVNLAYLPKNMAPVIDDIVVQEPGVRVQGFAAPSGGPSQSAPVQLRQPQRGGTGIGVFSPGAAAAVATGESVPKPPRMEIPPQGVEQKGWMSVLWSAHDDNDDDLTFSIYFRGEGEENWRLLKDHIEQRYYSWDSTQMPDGAYHLKIVASDAPSNPTDEVLTTEKISDRFIVDNTPPAIGRIRAEDVDARGNARIRFEARDSASTISSAEYSLDAGEWKIVFPAGRLSDSLEENYELKLTGLSAGEHTVSVRVADRFQNTATAQVTFTVPGRASR